MSAISRATETKRTGDGDAARSKRRVDKTPGHKSSAANTDVTLMHGRWRHFGWMVFWLALGSLLVVKLDTVGQGVGIVFLLLGAWQAVQFVRTLLFEPGTISITPERVVLPLGLCRPGEAHVADAGDVRRAYFLRRAIPFMRTGPMLVIETADSAFLYPRDWFMRESDQRRIMRVINEFRANRE